MQIRSLRMQHFRNYSDQIVEFHPQFNIIIGKNAQGKTNLLEALYYLANLKSFRTSTREELIQTGFPSAFLEAIYVREGIEHRISVGIEPSSRKVTLDGKKAASGTYFGSVPVLLFEPMDVYLLRDSPSARRRFWDRAVFLNDPSFLKIERNYAEVVTQKNRLLKENAPFSLVDVFNEQLADLGSQIISKRVKILTQFNEILSEEYKRVSGISHQIEMKCLPSFERDENITDPKHLKTLLYQAIIEKTDAERQRRETLVGPHREDFRVLADSRDLGQYGSQGENRSLVIALKSAQIHLFIGQMGFPPLFLLDDIASELDAARVESLFTYLRETSGQVFLTTTELSAPLQWMSEHGHCFQAEKGILC